MTKLKIYLFPIIISTACFAATSKSHLNVTNHTVSAAEKAPGAHLHPQLLSNSVCDLFVSEEQMKLILQEVPAMAQSIDDLYFSSKKLYQKFCKTPSLYGFTYILRESLKHLLELCKKNDNLKILLLNDFPQLRIHNFFDETKTENISKLNDILKTTHNDCIDIIREKKELNDLRNLIEHLPNVFYEKLLLNLFVASSFSYDALLKELGNINSYTKSFLKFIKDPQYAIFFFSENRIVIKDPDYIFFIKNNEICNRFWEIFTSNKLFAYNFMLYLKAGLANTKHMDNLLQSAGICDAMFYPLSQHHINVRQDVYKQIVISNITNGKIPVLFSNASLTKTADQSCLSWIWSMLSNTYTYFFPANYMAPLQQTEVSHDKSDEMQSEIPHKIPTAAAASMHGKPSTITTTTTSSYSKSEYNMSSSNHQLRTTTERTLFSGNEGRKELQKKAKKMTTEVLQELNALYEAFHHPNYHPTKEVSYTSSTLREEEYKKIIEENQHYQNLKKNFTKFDVFALLKDLNLDYAVANSDHNKFILKIGDLSFTCHNSAIDRGRMDIAPHLKNLLIRVLIEQESINNSDSDKL